MVESVNQNYLLGVYQCPEAGLNATSGVTAGSLSIRDSVHAIWNKHVAQPPDCLNIPWRCRIGFHQLAKP